MDELKHIAYEKKKLLVISGMLIVAGFIFFSIWPALPVEKTPMQPSPTPWTKIQVSQPPDNQSGGSGEAFKKLLEDNPQLQIEANLKTQLPIKQEKFTVTFDYGKDKFIVTLNNSFSDSRITFQQWLKDQKITDPSSFEIVQ